MLVAETKRNIQSSGDFQTNNFSILASAAAFRTLSEKLYSNKPQAILRELSCNAYDAHIMAGHAKPFDVHLPTFIEPTLTIRDYGPGLSHEDVMGLYTTYFRSTKQTSNDFIGCFGLGSKSPFAYTDSFAVTSYFNGEKRDYNMYIGTDDTPCVSLLNVGQTNKPNGLEVSLSVNRNDYTAFADEAKRVFQYFRVKPNITGNKIEIPVLNKVLSGEGWFRLDNNRYDANSYAVMGNVVYPIIPDKFRNGELTQIHRNLLNCKLHFVFNIGEVEVAPSREYLSYDDKTRKNIIAKLDIIAVELEQSMKDKVAKCVDDYDKKLYYVELSSNSYSGISSVIPLEKVFGRGFSNQCVLATNVDITPYATCIYKTYNNKVKGSTCHFFYLTANTVFFEDTAQHSHSRIGKWMVDNKRSEDVVLLKFEDDTQRLNFEQAVGRTNPTIIKTETLDKPAPQKRTVKTIQCYSLNVTTGRIEQDKIDLSTGGIFVHQRINAIVCDYWDYRSQARFARNAPGLLKILGETRKVYIFRNSVIKRMSAKKYQNIKWENLFDVAKSRIQSILTQSGMLDVVHNDEYSDYLNKYNRITKFYRGKGAMDAFVKKLENLKLIDSANKAKEIVSLAQTFGVDTSGSSWDMKEAEKQLFELYPMLAFIDETGPTDTKSQESVGKYLEMVDTSR